MQTTFTQTQKKTSVFTADNVVWFISRLFIALFVYTALVKLINPDKFFGTISDVPMVKPFASFLTYAVPYTELLISLLLLIPDKKTGTPKKSIRRIGFIAGGGLMLAFTIYIGLMLVLYGSKLPCSCGGFVSELSWTAHIYFNLAFVGLSMWALLLYKRMQIR